MHWRTPGDPTRLVAPISTCEFSLANCQFRRFRTGPSRFTRYTSVHPRVGRPATLLGVFMSLIHSNRFSSINNASYFGAVQGFKGVGELEHGIL